MFDLIITGGTVIDGTGAPARVADVGIEGESVTAVGDLASAAAHQAIDATGRYVTPGFIDIHTHSDVPVLVNPRLESKVRQGVTTEVGGNCGMSVAPLAGLAIAPAEHDLARYGLALEWRSMGEYLATVEKKGTAVNFAVLTGHSALRKSAMGFDMRPPREEEMATMKRLLARSLEEGALGLSTGLIYPPSCYAETGELIELARVAADRGGIYASHIRNEAHRLLPSVEEAIRVGEEAHLPVQIAHLKANGRPNWGQVVPALEMIDRARQRGVDVTFDRYPYVASSTGLAAVLPHWSHEGGSSKLVQRLHDPQVRRQIAEEVVQARPDSENMGPSVGWENILIANCRANHAYDGQRLTEIAAAQGKAPLDCVFDLLIENEGEIACVFFGMCEEDLATVLRHPVAMIGSDAGARAPYGPLGEGKPHPRAYGTFVRVLGEYVRQRKVLTWEEAIASMTSRPADRLGLRGRGRLAEGAYADLVVFDPQTVADTATFLEPHRYPQGIDYVVVNGTIVVERGEHTGKLAGKVLRRGA